MYYAAQSTHDLLSKELCLKRDRVIIIPQNCKDIQQNFRLCLCGDPVDVYGLLVCSENLGGFGHKWADISPNFLVP